MQNKTNHMFTNSFFYRTRACADDVTRTEMLLPDWFDQSKAAMNVRQCYCDMEAKSDCISTVLQLPVPVLAALHALVKYLTDFKLQKILKVNRYVCKFMYSQCKCCEIVYIF